MRSDVSARRGPTTLFGAPLGRNEKVLFEMARVPSDGSRAGDPAAGADDAAAAPRGTPQPRPCSER